MPSSLHARITRRAISPRFATSTFLNISGREVAAQAGCGGGAAERPALPGLHPRHLERELARVRGVEERALVADDAVLVPLKQHGVISYDSAVFNAANPSE